MTTISKDAPSKGTEFSYERDGEIVDVFRGADGEWYNAPRGNVVDVRTGYRIGRWQGPARWTVEQVAEFFGVDSRVTAKGD